MPTMGRFLVGLTLAGAMAVPFAMDKDGGTPRGTARPELEYLRAVNRAGPPQDPQLLFLLMGQYANANLHREGAEQISALLKEFGPRLSDAQKSLYLSAIGAFRTGVEISVDCVPRRIGRDRLNAHAGAPGRQRINSLFRGHSGCHRTQHEHQRQDRTSHRANS